jgi:hypothetical protein
MPHIQFIVILVVIGVVLYLINNYIPMDGKIKTMMNVLVVVLACAWLLDVFGVLRGANGLHLGALGL